MRGGEGGAPPPQKVRDMEDKEAKAEHERQDTDEARSTTRRGAFWMTTWMPAAIMLPARGKERKEGRDWGLGRLDCIG